MTTQLKEAMTSGLFIEFRDSAGNTVGQALYTDWRGRPVPALGDMMSSDFVATQASQRRRIRGCVIARHFELQREPDGSPCVWVRLIVETCSSVSHTHGARKPAAFSRN
jgi:hypothetical protein